MIESILAVLHLRFKTSTHRVDIAQGKYKIPETWNELLKMIKTKNK
jgi:hypothetical protein